MVRILTCHHFGGQKITKCEEGLQLTVADDYVIVALEHQVAVYCTDYPTDNFSYLGKFGLGQGSTRDGGDIGSSPIYFDRPSAHNDDGSGGGNTNTGSKKIDTEIKFSHSFPTVDLIDTMSYNRRGNYLLCLEKRDNVGSEGKRMTGSIRLYFNWDNATDGKPMRARIAGLVSPTGAEPDDDTLVMIEIPPPQPMPSANTSNTPGILAVASCNILGHLASLTDASTVNIYSYRLKDSKGRASKNQYADFDFSYTVELLSMSMEKLQISFIADIIAVWTPTQVSVIRLMKFSRHRTRSISNDSEKSGGSSGGRRSVNSSSASTGFSPLPPVAIPPTSLLGNKSGTATEDFCDKVVFDPKNESVKVHMNLITRANHKRRFPDSGAGIYEEFQEEIGAATKSRLLFSISSPPLVVEDLLRVFLTTDQQQSNFQIVQVGLFANKIKDDLGGISCIVGTSSQAFVYHIPVRRDGTVSRVVTYPLTAPLVSFAFDSMFFHALTETGLETYTSRSLYYPLKEMEGFQRYKNDCPFLDETPSLIGIRPFMGVRYLAANELLLCLLSSPTASHPVGTSADDNLWTIYALQLPSVEMLYEDMSKAAILAKSTNPETYLALTSELHLVLRAFVNINPDMENHFLRRYQKTCKTIGIEYFKIGSNLVHEATRMSEGMDKYKNECLADEYLDKGVTFLIMAGTDLRHVFEEDPNTFIKDKKMIKGVTRFINVVLPEFVDSAATSLSPKLAAVVTDFLVLNSPETLVQLAIAVPILRESNSAKLIQILRKMAESSGYKKKESVALLLTLVTMSGCDAITRGHVKEILNKCESKEMETYFELSWILDLRHASKPKITDLAVCLSSAGSHISAHVICQALERADVTIGQVMMAFSQGINLNSDLDVQHALTRTLTSILEQFFIAKLHHGTTINLSRKPPMTLSTIESKTNAENDLISNKPLSAQPILLQFSDEESHAIKTLARSYISHISLRTGSSGGVLSPVHQRKNSGDRGSGGGSIIKQENPAKTDAPKKPKTKAGGVAAVIAAPAITPGTNQISPVATRSQPIDNVAADDVARVNVGQGTGKQPESSNKNILSEQKLTPFGKVPNFLVHIIKDTQTHINTNSTAFQVLTNLTMPSEETREYFIKLSSLLASPLSNTHGLREVVINFLESKGSPGSTLHICLQMLAEPCEKAIITLIAKYPLALMYYAKEMFGRSTAKWKILVTKLKEKIYTNSDDVEIFATIIESVYLYLANTLTPTELEEVLDKGEENSRFFKACRRTELANSYSQMILQMSNEYL